MHTRRRIKELQLFVHTSKLKGDIQLMELMDAIVKSEGIKTGVSAGIKGMTREAKKVDLMTRT